MTLPTPPDGFRHIIPLQVRWGDMDALGHVNNATYLTYCEQARVAYSTDLKLWRGEYSPYGVIMARAVVDYKLPLVAGDDVFVCTRAKRLGNRSLEWEQHIVRQTTDGALEVACVAVITGVVFDYTTKKSIPIPAEWRQIVRDYEPTPPEE